MTPYEAMCRDLIIERFGKPTPRPPKLPHISHDALRELLEDLNGAEDEEVA